MSLTESRIPRCVSRSRRSTVISFFFGATVYAAGGYGEAGDSVSSSRVGRRFFSAKRGAEGGDTNSPPVGDAAGEGDVGGFGGADRSTEGNEMFDHVAVGAHAHLVAAVADGDGGGSGFFASERKRAESVIMSSRTSPRMLW